MMSQNARSIYTLMTRLFTYLFLAALFLSTNSVSSAQESNTRKLFLESSIDGQSLSYRDDGFDSADRGGGFSFRVGWGISDLATLYIGVNGSKLDGINNGVIEQEYEFGALEIGSRFNFRTGQTLVPFADVALRGVAVQLQDVDLEFTGGGLMLGGGASYFVSPAVALTAGLRFGFGNFDEIRLGGITANIEDADIGFGELRYSFGVIFYPIK